MKDREKVCREVLQFLRQGYAYSQAAAQAGISRQTLYLWRKDDKAFDEECDVAEADSIAPIENKVRAIALGAEDQRLAFDASKFILERRKPSRNDYAPANPNGLALPALNLNVLAQVAPPVMQLDRHAQQPVIEGQVISDSEAA